MCGAAIDGGNRSLWVIFYISVTWPDVGCYRNNDCGSDRPGGREVQKAFKMPRSTIAGRAVTYAARTCEAKSSKFFSISRAAADNRSVHPISSLIELALFMLAF